MPEGLSGMKDKAECEDTVSYSVNTNSIRNDIRRETEDGLLN